MSDTTIIVMAVVTILIGTVSLAKFLQKLPDPNYEEDEGEEKEEVPELTRLPYPVTLLSSGKDRHGVLTILVQDSNNCIHSFKATDKDELLVDTISKKYKEGEVIELIRPILD